MGAEERSHEVAGDPGGTSRRPVVISVSPVGSGGNRNKYQGYERGNGTRPPPWPQHVVIRLQRGAAGAMGLPRGGVGWGTGGEQSPVGGAPQSSLGRGVCKAERGPRGHSVLCSGSCEPSPRPISLELERGEERPLTPTALSWWPCGDHLLVEAQKQSGWSQARGKWGLQPSLCLPIRAGSPRPVRLLCSWEAWAREGRDAPGTWLGATALTVHPACGSFPCGALAIRPHCWGPASVYLGQAPVPRACMHTGGWEGRWPASRPAWCGQA